MKTKKSNTKSNVSKRDLLIAIEALKDYKARCRTFASGLFGFGLDTNFDRALTPFDLVADGGVCKDNKLRDMFGVAWQEAVKAFERVDGKGECFITLLRVLKMFERVGSPNFNLGVFVADYGYFRGVLVKCLYWHASSIGGCSRGVTADVEKISDTIEKNEDWQKRRDIKIIEFELSMNGVNAKRREKSWQELKALQLFRGKYKDGDDTKKVRKICLECCVAVLRNPEYKKYESGEKVDMSLGYSFSDKYTFQTQLLRRLERIGICKKNR